MIRKTCPSRVYLCLPGYQKCSTRLKTTKSQRRGRWCSRSDALAVGDHGGGIHNVGQRFSNGLGWTGGRFHQNQWNAAQKIWNWKNMNHLKISNILKYSQIQLEHKCLQPPTSIERQCLLPSLFLCEVRTSSATGEKSKPRTWRQKPNLWGWDPGILSKNWMVCKQIWLLWVGMSI